MGEGNVDLQQGRQPASIAIEGMVPGLECFPPGFKLVVDDRLPNRLWASGLLHVAVAFDIHLKPTNLFS